MKEIHEISARVTLKLYKITLLTGKGWTNVSLEKEICDEITEMIKEVSDNGAINKGLTEIIQSNTKFVRHDKDVLKRVIQEIMQKNLNIIQELQKQLKQLKLLAQPHFLRQP